MNIVHHSTLGDLIVALEDEDPNKVVQHGFSDPHVFRGYYSDCAFVARNDITVAAMLSLARSVLRHPLEAPGGAEAQYTINTKVWIVLNKAAHGPMRPLTPLLLDMMLERPIVLSPWSLIGDQPDEYIF